MPDMFAHYTVAEAARQSLPDGPLARLLAAEHDAFTVGAQGPDFLFYSGLWPWQAGRNDLARLLHRHAMSAVFRSMLGHADGLGAAGRAIAGAFVCGYAAHLCLDAGAHPWVLYWTGDISADAPAGTRVRALRSHGLLEGSLDVMLLREHSSAHDWLRRQSLLRMSAARTTVVAEMFEHVFADVHGIAFTAAEGRAAFRDMALVSGAMSDRHTPFSRLLAGLGPLVDRTGAARAQIYPDEPLAAAERLVTGRRRWHHPSLPRQERTETLRELLVAAGAETRRCLEAIAPVACGETGDVDEAVATIGDRSMLTGLPCGDRRPLVAFAPGRDLIWAG